MAQRKYLNETGLSYFWGKIKNYLKYRNIIPEQSKTFTNVIGTANSWAGATFFYGSIKPTDWNVLWEIHFRIRTYVPGKTQYDMIADVRISGTQGDLRSYASYNTVGTYYPAYYHELYRLKSAGLTNGYGHSLGVRFYSAYSPTDTNYKRTIVVDIFETKNCTFTFYDSCLAYSAIPGTGSTNYNTYSEMNYCSNGLQEIGDSDTINQNRICYTYRKPFITLYRYQICFCRADGTVLPGNSVDNAPSNINKTLTTEEFDPFGEIYYYNSTSTISTTSNIGTNTLYRQVLADLRYSFNVAAESGKCLVGSKAVYVAAIPQANGMAKFASPALVQDLPASDDGKIYIYLGNAYPDTYPYRVELQFEHPIYWYKNGAIRPYVGVSQVNSHATGISIANHGTSSITGVSGSVTGSHVKSGGNGTAPTLGTAFTVPNVTAKGSGSFTQGSFSGGSFTQGTDSFTQNTPTVIDTSKFSGGSFTRGTFSGGSGSFTQGAFSGGSFTQGTDSFTANTPTVINTSKFSGGSFTRGTFSGGSGSFTSGAFNGGSGSFSATVSNHVMSFSHTHTAATHASDSHTHTAATHAADSFTAASLQSGFYTAGTAASFTQGTDSFTPATHGNDSHTHTAATHAADTFTAAKLNSGFYTAGTKATFTQGTDSFSPATHGADSHTHTAPTLGTAFTIPNVTSVGSASNWVFENVTVPKAASATTVVTGASHTITDNGHTHTLS